MGSKQLLTLVLYARISEGLRFFTWILPRKRSYFPSLEKDDSMQTSSPFQSLGSEARSDAVPSSPPAFETPIRVHDAHESRCKPTILPILLPSATLRPSAVRVFKKHNLNITSVALQALAKFIGRYCGSGWREEGLAEKVMEEVARAWKKNGGTLIVDGDSSELRNILKNLESCIDGGRLVQKNELSQDSFTLTVNVSAGVEYNTHRHTVQDDSQTNSGVFQLDVGNADSSCQDPRKWLQVIGAFEQPRLAYNASKRQFDKNSTSISLLPSPLQKTNLFRNRYNLIYQRLLRNESFQAPTVVHSRASALQRTSSTLTTQQAYKLTPIANLLGRNGTNHVLLGLLTISPTGTLTISDLTGSIGLDLSHAHPVPENGAWFTPGMIVIVDGIYEETASIAGSLLGNRGGVGGTIGGKFVGLSVGGPPCERREVTLGLNGSNGEAKPNSGGGFGWVDFLGVGSERVAGPRMRKLQEQILGRTNPNSGRGKIVVLGEVCLDEPQVLLALRKVLSHYAGQSALEIPMVFILTGNFVTHAAISGRENSSSVEYKEYFDTLASLLSDYPTVLQASTFIFVPGDNDPWASAFTSGAAALLPRRGIPELFTSRVKRSFAAANAEVERPTSTELPGEAIWTSNPARVSLFGLAQEIVICRDDISSRLRRSALRFGSNEIAKDGPLRSSDLNGDSATVDGDFTTMDIDPAVRNAESHLPAPRSMETAECPSEDVVNARKLVKTILDQGFLSPFPLSSRPICWDLSWTLQLYPLPTALVLVDPEAPSFAVTYEGCHVMNPARLLVENRKKAATWLEYDIVKRQAKRQEANF